MSKKKILLLSDDLRMSSGVGTMSREFVKGTLQHFDWVQIGGAIKHPDQGQVFDLSRDVEKDIPGLKDAYLKIYPTHGYGNPDMLREIMGIEKPDAILHYTDPRFWQWLYQMEHELRQETPIFYYNIWDDLPYPRWNENFYESCDLIMNISKQTHNIVENVCRNKPRTEWDSTYLPHGINEKNFFPISDEELSTDEKFQNFQSNVLKGKKKEFILFFNARNIKRKMIGDIILAYNKFCSMLSEEEASKCLLLLHTTPVDKNGTHLPDIVEELCPYGDVGFSAEKLSDEALNMLYNMADCTILTSSNEGFGLSGAESIMCGTPVILNVTGGMQDQCGFKLDGEFITYKDYSEIHSLHDYRKWENNDRLTHGDWVKPVWPKTRSLMGSVPTPYIFDDRCDWEEVADKIKEWHQMGREERKKCGMVGHDWACSDESMMSARWMSQNFIDHMDTAFENWKPRKRFTIFKV
jgi:glycosyltransferase involved in cell wall biosynthesis